MSSLFGDFPVGDTNQNDFSNLFAEFDLHARGASPALDIKQGNFTTGGYFVFPPLSPKVDERIPFAREANEQKPSQAPSDHSGKASHKITHESKHADEDAETVEENREKQRQKNERQKRLEKEREVASIGEIEWVRSGGVLRDAQGRRDKVRTESIRQEIRLQEREKLLTERWRVYEAKWRALLTEEGPVFFKDMPWPIQTCPSAVEDLTFVAISDFLLEPLEVRTNTITKRERIRTSLLRWHPDKMSSILCRVVEEDVDIVREGIGAVFMCLKRMKEN